MDDKEKLLFSTSEACDALGIGRSKLYELIGQGHLDPRTLGGRTFIPTAALKKFVAELPPAPIRGAGVS